MDDLCVFRADLHVHTCLSPCGSLDMSPVRIIREAREKQIDILGITDHNSTRQCKVIMELGQKAGITVWGGAEINTREEVHCLALFDDWKALEAFQQWLDRWLTVIRNKPDYFGHQVWVDEKENILGVEDRLLIAALDRSMEQSYDEVHRLGGIFIPAHINRKSYSLISQLGFVSPDIKADALEICKGVKGETIERMRWAGIKPLIGGSDAHYPEQLGTGITLLKMKNRTLNEFKKALKGEMGRGVLALPNK
ncbi:PHP domain-containing protein [Thermophagus sp. OGC60D27]|uniref:PHP domain-containing protein n=1 Tax=Thermophagus sp. OGC60D27 TaxID=3458415 RepID=UPI004037DC7B